MLKFAKCAAWPLLVVVVMGALMAFIVWRESPHQKMLRLLQELDDLPAGKDFYFGRSFSQITGDIKSMGPKIDGPEHLKRHSISRGFAKHSSPCHYPQFLFMA